MFNEGIQKLINTPGKHEKNKRNERGVLQYDILYNGVRQRTSPVNKMKQKTDCKVMKIFMRIIYPQFRAINL